MMLQIEINCLQIVQDFHSTGPDFFTFNVLIDDIKSPSHDFVDVFVLHVSRHVNGVAHKLIR